MHVCCVCVCMHMGAPVCVSVCICVKKKSGRSQLSPSIVWILRVELRSSDLARVAFT